MLEACGRSLRILINLPEASIALFAFLLNWPWEFMQVPFFQGMRNAPHWEGVQSCARATLGDVLIMLLAYWAVAAAARDRHWLLHSRKAQLAAFVAVGVVITVLIERLALSGWWMGGWSYAPGMFLIPLVGVGLTPVLQWLLLPPLAVGLARRQLKGGAATTLTPSGGVSTGAYALDLRPHPPSREFATAEFGSYTFLLDGSGNVRPLPHAVYVALARDEAVVPALASQAFRLADLYVKHAKGRPAELTSEWYGWVSFDENGALNPISAPPHHDGKKHTSNANIDSSALPNDQEREALLAASAGSGGVRSAPA